MSGRQRETLEKVLGSWSAACEAHPRRVTIIAVLAVVLLGLAIFSVRFVTDLNVMIPTRSGQTLQRIERTFGARQQAFLILESDEASARTALVAFARAIAARLSETEHFVSVSHGSASRLEEFQRLLAYAPRFLSPTELDGLDETLSEADLAARLGRQLGRLSLPGMDSLEMMRRDPFDLAQILRRRLSSQRGAYRFDPSSPHFLSEDGQSLLVLLRGRAGPDDTEAVRQSVAAVWNAVASARQVLPDTSVRVTAGGAYFLTAEAETVIRNDLTISISLSMVLVVALVSWTLRGVRAALLTMPPLLFGIVTGIGVYGPFRDGLATLALGSAAILVGLGVDFAVHLLLRSAVLRAEGRPGSDAVVAATRQTGPGLVFAALTTIGAFLAFELSGYSFLRDMGALTAIGILATLIATVSLLPPLASRWLRAHSGSGMAPRSLGVDWAVSKSLASPGAVLATAIITTLAAVASITLAPPRFETDLRRIHSRDSAPLAAERRLEEVFGASHEPLLLLLEANEESDLEADLRRLRGALRTLHADGTLVASTSAALLLPEAAVEQGWIAQFSTDSAPAFRERLHRSLEVAGFSVDELEGPVEELVNASFDAQPLSFKRLRELGLSPWLDEFVGRDPDRDGALLGLAALFPSKSLWTESARDSTLDKIRNTLAEADLPRCELAGLFTVSAESARLVASEMWRTGTVAFGIALVLVFVFFRGLTTVVLVLLPVTLACIWTAAFFTLAGYTIHFMNAAVIPMIVGIGIDDGIHVLHRYRTLRSQHRDSSVEKLARALSVTGAGVALTSLTTMVAFGSLALSSNRGIASIGVLCLFGIGSALVVTVTVLPAAISILERRFDHGRRPP